MKTLYIPTTTLNFNNIMSSESISPKAFYSNREFGYKTWHSVNENPFENSILLYEAMPLVKREICDYDDYPLIIAVTVSEEVFEDMLFTNIPDVWQYDKTIYLNPSNTSIFFDSEEHKQIALSKSESSAETKMVALYKTRMFCAQMKKEYDVSNFRDIDLCIDAIKKDQRINKMKGLFYGYYIGASMSMSDKAVVKLNLLNEIKNVLAAILASLNGIATKEQITQLQGLFEQLQQFDPLRIELQNIIDLQEISTSEKVDRIVSLINNSNFRTTYSNYLPYLLNEIEKGKPEYGDNAAITWINKAIENQVRESNTQKTLLNTNEKEIVLSSLALSSISSKILKAGKPQELFIAIVNDVLISPKYNGKISTFKMELATEITYKAKEVFGEEWNDSCTAKIYLNALRKHIGGETFSQKWNSGLLSSIASVILKGDDWEKLLEFLQTKGVSDYRISFALYGMLNGFANLTRDFSDKILKEDKDYVCSFYQNCHYQIHGIEACVSDVPEFVKATINSNLRSEVRDVFNTLTPTQQRKNETRIEHALQLEADQGNFTAYLYILANLINSRTNVYKKIKSVLESPESKNQELAVLVNKVLSGFTKKSDIENCMKAREALVLEDKVGDPESFCYMLDDLSVPKDIRKKFFRHFKIQYQEQSPLKKVGNFIGELFSGQEDNNPNEPKMVEKKIVSFSIHNVNAIADFIKSKNPSISDFAYKQIVKDLNWVFDPNYSVGKSEMELLETFRVNLISGQRDPISRNGKDMKWKNDAYKNIDIDKTINALKEIIINER